MAPSVSLTACRARAHGSLRAEEANVYERTTDLAVAQEVRVLTAGLALEVARSDLALLDEWLEICEEGRLGDFSALPAVICEEIALSPVATDALRQAAAHKKRLITPIQDAIFDAEELVMRRISVILGPFIVDDEEDEPAKPLCRSQ